MNEKLKKDIFAISSAFASTKRILMLWLLSKEPKPYGEILKYFNEINVPISAHEIYTHLRLLKEKEMVVSTNRQKKFQTYVVTKKGMVAVEKIKEIVETEARVPEVRMDF